jgi:membrane protein
MWRAIQQFNEDGVSAMGAALAYYALFSTAPLLILAVLMAGQIFGEAAARIQLEEHITEFIGQEGARQVIEMMQHAMKPAQGGLAAGLGIAALVLGALGVFLHIRRCLCTIWRLPPQHGGGILASVINYVLAILMVVCVGLLLLVSLAISAALPVALEYLGEDLSGRASLWHWVEVGVSFALLTLFFALIYRIMSAQQIAWGYVLYGALICALFFTAGKTVIGWYLAHSSTASAYGAAASLVIFLVWIYYSAQIFFFGAELIQARRTRREWMNVPHQAA